MHTNLILLGASFLEIERDVVVSSCETQTKIRHSLYQNVSKLISDQAMCGSWEEWTRYDEEKGLWTWQGFHRAVAVSESSIQVYGRLKGRSWTASGRGSDRWVGGMRGDFPDKKTDSDRLGQPESIHNPYTPSFIHRSISWPSISICVITIAQDPISYWTKICSLLLLCSIQIKSFHHFHIKYLLFRTKCQ